jgi:probable addiction module antidote protein
MGRGRHAAKRMEARERQILYYVPPGGSPSPFRVWRDGIRDKTLKVTVTARIARMRGCNFGDSFPIGGGASENRIDFGPGYRIYETSGAITKKDEMNRNEDYKADLLAELRSDPQYAAEYLTAARADSNEAFLVALRDVAEAHKGMKRVAKEAKVNRENLYRALSKKGNPSSATLEAVLDVLGIGVKFFPKASATAHRKASTKGAGRKARA